MPLTSEEIIINLTEDIETLLGYIKYAEEEGYRFPTSMELDIAGIQSDLEKVYDGDYGDYDLMEDI